MKVFVNSLEDLLSMDNVRTIDIVDVLGKVYSRNTSAEQLFENVLGVRPNIFMKDMWEDCGSIMSEYGTMVVIHNNRFLKFYGADNMFMDVQGN